MFKQTPFPFSMLVLGILVIFHSAASYYSWYWMYSWFDVITHLLAGLWVGLILLWLASSLGEIRSLKDYHLKSLNIVLISTVVIGITWELLEVYMQITLTSASGYGLDTAVDILSGAIGGFLAYLYFVRRSTCKKDIVPIIHPIYDQVNLIKNT